VLGDVIGALLPSAIGVALSPVPIVAVILVLDTPKARSNGPAFALGWVLGLAVVAAIVLPLAGGDDDGGGTSTPVALITLAFGLLMLGVAVQQWRGRPREGHEAELPGWMAAVDKLTAPKSFVLGAGLSGVNPKNLALTLAASASIAQADLSTGDDVIAIAVFVVLGSITVAGPVLASMLLGARVEQPLAEVKRWMSENNAVIMAVVCLVLGAKLVGEGIGGLTD
jgi:threonine/homoserine/homoserine lactone efflux protein